MVPLYGNSNQRVSTRGNASPTNNFVSSPNPYYHQPRPVSPNPQYQQMYHVFNPYSSSDSDTMVLDGLQRVSKRGNASPTNNFVSSPNPFYHQPRPVSPNPQYQQMYHVFNPYSSSDSDTTVLDGLDSPLIRYFQSRSQASPVGDFPPLIGYHGSNTGVGSINVAQSPRLELPRPGRSPLPFKSVAPVKLEEEVLVMDGIPLKTPPASRARSLSLSAIDSGGSSSSSSSVKNYKNEVSRFHGEVSGNHNHLLKGQFAHAKEEPRSMRFPQSCKVEIPATKHYSPSETHSNGSRSHFLHHETSPAASSTAATSSTQPNSPVRVNEFTTSILNIKHTDWSPQDDGIEIPTSLAKTQSRQAVDAYISKVLYGPRTRKRLPFFVKICPE